MQAASVNNPILSTWRETLARRGNAIALFSDQGLALRTFSEIEAEAREWMAVFSEAHALTPGSVVGLQTGNRPELPALLLACWHLGLVPLPLGRPMEPAKRAEALETCGATALVEVIDRHLALTPLPYSRPTWGEPRPDFLKLTSGTTSAPRAVRFRAAQLLADCVQICETMGIDDADLNYGVIPLSHSYGFSNLATPLLCRGVSMVLSEDPMPRAILDGLARTGATVFPGMPVFFDKLAGLAECQDVPGLPKLRLCISAGAPLLPAVAARFTTKYGLRIHTFYGASECGGIGYDQDQDSYHAYAEGFAGTPMKSVQITPAPDGTIAVESEAVGDGYWPVGPEPDPAPGNGRFIPSDLVRVEPSGMYVAGRISDIINVAGRKLNPLEVEAQLLRFPGVRQAVVFGVPSPLRNEEAVACVAGDFSPHDLLNFVRSALSGWQMPKDIWVVSEIPTTERGKISRRDLALHYAEAKGLIAR